MSKLALAIAIITFGTLALSQNALQPKVFEPGLISAGSYDTSVEFTPDGNTLYFLRGAPDFSFWTIYESHKIAGKWSNPKVAPFSGQSSSAVRTGPRVAAERTFKASAYHSETLHKSFPISMSRFQKIP